LSGRKASKIIKVKNGEIEEIRADWHDF
jgi:hypothetical protein